MNGESEGIGTGLVAVLDHLSVCECVTEPLCLPVYPMDCGKTTDGS